MHWESFYAAPEDIGPEEVLLRDEEAHHLYRVLRKRNGDEIWVIDGRGTAYRVRLTRISGLEAAGRILETRRHSGEPLTRVTLAAALLKGDRFEWLIEKSVELGVHRILPVISEFTIPSGKSNKRSRWSRIARTAAKQCGRSVIPAIEPPQSFESVLEGPWTDSVRLMADSSGLPLGNVLNRDFGSTPKLILLTGPEGGWSAGEIDTAREQGAGLFTLGPRRLRAETAALLGCSLLLNHFQEFE